MANNFIIKHPFVSIIIPTWREAKILNRCLDSLLNQNYPKDKYEIILVSANKLDIKEDKIKVLYINRDVNPAQARNLGTKMAKGEILAFVDDDCIIPQDWISKAVKYFQKRDIALVGGPALPLKNQPFRYRLGGYLWSSPFVAGFVSARYRQLSKVCEANNYNLILANNFLRKNVFESVFGFEADQHPCAEYSLYFRIKKAGYKLLYSPDIFVWHNAKPVFLPLINKIFYYATGRGLLVARKPKTIRFLYLIPSLFVICLLGTALLSFFFREFFYFLMGIFLIYSLWIIFNALYIFFKFEKNPLVLLYSPLAIFLAYTSYGLGFLFGVYKFISRTYKGGIKPKSKY